MYMIKFFIFFVEILCGTLILNGMGFSVFPCCFIKKPILHEPVNGIFHSANKLSTDFPRIPCGRRLYYDLLITKLV